MLTAIILTCDIQDPIDVFSDAPEITVTIDFSQLHCEKPKNVWSTQDLYGNKMK